jgi:hypothetical protein
LNKLEEKTDLVLKDANFDDNMGLYTCQICCQKGCQELTSFVYPVRFFSKKDFFFIKLTFSSIRLDQTSKTNPFFVNINRSYFYVTARWC